MQVSRRLRARRIGSSWERCSSRDRSIVDGGRGEHHRFTGCAASRMRRALAPAGVVRAVGRVHRPQRPPCCDHGGRQQPRDPRSVARCARSRRSAPWTSSNSPTTPGMREVRTWDCEMLLLLMRSMCSCAPTTQCRPAGRDPRLARSSRPRARVRRTRTHFERQAQRRRQRRATRGGRCSGPVIDVEWLPGLCLLVRCAAVRSIGGFDESYGSYVEDVDLCRRMVLAWMASRSRPRCRRPRARVLHGSTRH